MCFMCFRLWVLVSESLYNQCADNVTPILTWEYWNPDWWETLTWPYLDVQTIQIQELQKENSRLEEVVMSVESKLKVESLCGELWCWAKVWFMTNYSILSWRVVLYSEESIREWEVWSYRIQTEDQYNSQEYIGFDSIIAPSDIYKSKKELLKTIKWM